VFVLDVSHFFAEESSVKLYNTLCWKQLREEGRHEGFSWDKMMYLQKLTFFVFGTLKWLMATRDFEM
jgi:hypothetical protein